MSFIREILKGIIIGVACIVPGVSGGTMSIAMGIYDKLISAVTNVFKDFKNSVKTLMPYVIGAVIGVITLSFFIEFAFERFPIQTNMVFVGLIIGGLPMLWNKVKGKKLGASHLIAFLVFFVFIIVTTMMGEQEGGNVILTTDLGGIIKLFGVGVIASATIVAPGVSGTMILMMMGYYQPLLNLINGFIKALVTFDIPALLGGIAILAPLGVGFVAGGYVIAKIIEVLMEKARYVTYCAIIGLIVASPFSILYVIDFRALNIVSGLTGLIAFTVGYVIATKLGEEDK